MKPNTYGSLFSEFISHFLWVNKRNVLNCNDLSFQPCFTKAFLSLDIICEDVAESLEWAHHPQYTVQGIQNLWEFPEETLSQISSKNVSKFPYET